MRLQMFKMTKIMSMLFFTQVVTSSDSTNTASVKKFVSKLSQSIESERRYLEGDQLFTAFCLRKRDVTIGNFLNLYQTLCGTSEYEGMVTIIKIKNTNEAECNSAKHNLRNFVYALQQYVDQDKNSIYLDEKGLSVECFQQKYMSYYAFLDNVVYKKKQIHSYISDLVLKEVYDISCDLINYYIIRILKLCLCYQFYNDEPLENVKSKSIESDSEICYRRMIEYVNLHALKGQIFEIIDMSKSPLEIIFTKMYAEVEIFEEKIGLKLYKDDFESFKLFGKYLIRFVHLKKFGQIFEDIFDVLKKYIECDTNKEIFKNVYRETVEKMIQHFITNPISKTISIRDKGKILDGYIDNLKKNDDFVKRCKNYFDTLALKEKKGEYESMYHNKQYANSRELHFEKYTTIILNYKISKNEINELSHSLMDIRAFENSDEHKMIYLDKGKVLSESDMQKAAEIYETRDIAFNSDELYEVSDEEILEVLSTEHTQVDAKKQNTICMLSYKYNINDENYKENVRRVKKDKTTNSVAIKLEKYDKLICDETLQLRVDSLVKPLLTKNKNEKTSIHVVSVAIEGKIIYICIVYQLQVKSSKECLSIIYDCPNARRLTRSTNLKMHNREISRLMGIPVTCLYELADYLHYLSFESEVSFEIPNALQFNGNNYIYFSEPVEIGNYYLPSRYFDDFFEEIYNPENCTIKYGRIYIEQVLALVHKKDCLHDFDISRLAKALSVDNEEFVKFLFTIILRYNNFDCASDDKYISDIYNDYQDLQLYLTVQQNSKTSLHICEVRKYDKYKPLLDYPFKVFTTLLDDQNTCFLLDKHERIAKKYGLKNRLYALLVEETFKFVCHSWNHSIGKDIECDWFEYIRYICVYINDLVKPSLHALSADGTAQTTTNGDDGVLNDLLYDEDIVRIVNVLLNVLKKVYNSQTAKMTTIIIKTPEFASSYKIAKKAWFDNDQRTREQGYGMLSSNAN